MTVLDPNFLDSWNTFVVPRNPTDVWSIVETMCFWAKDRSRSSGGGAPEAMASKLQLLQRDLKIVKEALVTRQTQIKPEVKS